MFPDALQGFQMERGLCLSWARASICPANWYGRIVPRSKHVEEPEANSVENNVVGNPRPAAQLVRPVVDGLNVGRAGPL